jgi:hypothetical protein
MLRRHAEDKASTRVEMILEGTRLLLSNHEGDVRCASVALNIVNKESFRVIPSGEGVMAFPVPLTLG